MSPLLACVPGCLTFVSLALVGVILYLAGAGAGAPGQTEADGAPAAPARRPPYWVAPAVLLVVVLVLLLLSLVTDG